MLYFGTDGIRAANKSAFFSSKILYVLGQALALWNQEKKNRTKNILCIYDTRASASHILHALTQGLMDAEHTLFDGGILPTPAAHWIMQKSPFDFAIIITASHNPSTDNGIKLLLPKSKITEADEQIIENHFSNLLLRTTKSRSRKKQTCVPFQQDAKKIFLEEFFSALPTPDLTGKKICIDCANGAITTVIHELLEPTNATIHLWNNKPNGRNINQNCGATHPHAISTYVKECNADLGFSFDGDGDRIISANAQGIIKTGDDLLAAILQHPVFSMNKTVVGTIMSNQGFARYLESQKKELIRAPIGDRNIIKSMVQNDSRLGGEPGGHIIILQPGIASSDGPAVMLWTLDSLTHHTDQLLAFFTPDIQITRSIKTLHKPDFSDYTPYKLALEKLHTIIPQGRSCIRYSGTEPLLRITVENSEAKSAEQALDILTNTFNELFA